MTEMRDSLSPARVALSLAVIALLAFVLPYGAVSVLHQRRLAAADRGIETVGAAVTGTRPLRAGEVLLGPGDRPRALDARWERAPSTSLSAIGVSASPDPWGNAYLVVTSTRGRASWVVSAGPDGILQTSFDPSEITAAGDDRVLRLR